LAESEGSFGVPITQRQIDEIRQSIDMIKYQIAFEPEREVREDAVAHLYAFAKQCLNP
jgi:adenylosuccinate lyase